MGWRDHLLRILARGALLPDAEGELDREAMIRTLDRIAADPALSERLDRMSESELQAAFRALYEEELEREA